MRHPLRPLTRRLVYPAPPWDPSATADRLVEVDEGTHLLHVPAPVGGPTVVYLHGNGSDIGTISPLADLVAAQGIGFAAPEYPGYGPSPGRPSEESVLAAARRGLDHLEGEGVDPAATVLVGESLGSAVAARLALDGGWAGLVLVSPFTSMTAMFRAVVRGLPERLVPDRYATEGLAAGLELPTLLLHGAEDSLVPPAMSAALAEVIPQARRVVVPGRDHNTLWEAPSQVLEEVVSFVREVT
ncbi:alpha/beta hydrolase [Marihabitans asiaticum]|uniref:Serine aminopeptidase S33 domain-containing protein n=1 Tax=Marihabitans asiaticum TaxID=415218 RepID=A0A560WES2_9MICO|nr:alpha/beta fold hydrolase [Marihabitans asiaticum]TWD16066.1 hypothetical protein FB557_1609 [Marihabitans asiaticum]